jgi:hypothetical protein
MPTPSRICHPTPRDGSNRDIREFVSPTPSRRRRIIESSSSDDQNRELQAGHQADEQPPHPHPAPNNENEHPEPIHISSSDESSDSMYVARPQPAEILQDRNGRTASQSQRRQATPSERHTSPQQQRQTRRRRPPSQQQGLNASSRRPRFDADAESTSEEESSGLSADESDPNAAELYRAAMLSVRNRPNAVQQVSAAVQSEMTSYIHSSELTRYHVQSALNSWNSCAIFETIEKQQRGIMHMHMPLPELIKIVKYFAAYMAK